MGSPDQGLHDEKPDQAPQSKPDNSVPENLRDPEAAQSEEERSLLKKQRSRQVIDSKY